MLSPPCAMTFLHVVYFIVECLQIMVICMQDLHSDVLYHVRLPATLRRSNSAKKRKESLYEAFILAVNGFWQVISHLTKL